VEPGVNGLKIPLQDWVALAEAVEDLASRPHDLGRMGQAGRAFVEAHYDENTVIEHTMLAYHRCLVRSGANIASTD
jgi:colanic acid/amylovoran biosynthesis glycosyltransferase